MKKLRKSTSSEKPCFDQNPASGLGSDPEKGNFNKFYDKFRQDNNMTLLFLVSKSHIDHLKHTFDIMYSSNENIWSNEATAKM